MTDSSTAVDTPIISGTTLLRSAHLYERHTFSFFSLYVCSADSNALYSRFCAFCVSENERWHTDSLPSELRNLSLICAFT